MEQYKNQNDNPYEGSEAVVQVKPSLFKKFIKTFFAVFLVFVLCTGIALVAYSMLSGSNPVKESIVAKNIDSNLKESSGIFDVFAKAPEDTTVLIVGLDNDSTRTDTIMIGHLNATSKQISLISIPRDTWVVIPDNRQEELSKLGLSAPAGGMKITELHSYIGPEYGIHFLSKQIEEMLGIEINYYLKVNLEAFMLVVETLGGVEFDVPQRMYYHDPYQDLLIDLQPGLQLLDPYNAMGLVRYRGYLTADWQRVQTQQDFVKAVAKQALEKENIVNNFMDYAKIFFEHVETNFSVADVPKYFNFIKDIDMDTINTYTIPGTETKKNGKDIIINDPIATKEIVEQVFYPFGKNPSGKPISSEKLSIQVLNGGFINGLASKTKVRLEEEGFTVSNIADFTDEKTNHTRIFVAEKGMGEDLKPMFPGSKIIVDQEMTNGYDITIVIGIDEE